MRNPKEDSIRVLLIILAILISTTVFGLDMTIHIRDLGTVELEGLKAFAGYLLFFFGYYGVRTILLNAIQWWMER